MTMHVAVFRWCDGVDIEKQTAVLSEALDRMVEQIPGLLSFERGGDLGLYPRSFDFVLVARFVDEDALRAYKENSLHEQVFRSCIEPMLEAQGSVQFEV